MYVALSGAKNYTREEKLKVVNYYYDNGKLEPMPNVQEVLAKLKRSTCLILCRIEETV